ncbi:MAG: ornithine carbamoyltransferase [Candidatus Micrarchaeota archaeon]
MNKISCETLNLCKIKPPCLLSMTELKKDEIEALLELAISLKSNPKHYAKALEGKTLLMLFEKPSLRTRLSFDVGMKQLGGNTSIFDAEQTPLGAKETIEDTAKVCGSYVDCIMARLYEHEKLVKLSENAGIPVINGLTNDEHPVQVLSDLLTIKEKKGKLAGLKMCYLGDGKNNVTHSLLIGCAIMDIDISVGCPKDAMPKKEYVNKAKGFGSGKIAITADPIEAVKNADIIYTDSWMSYHIEPSEKEDRVKKFMPYQVNSEKAKYAKSNFLFMNCLPAMRGCEQTAEIIDGPHSIVFDQAENRLHMQKAILLKLLR